MRQSFEDIARRLRQLDAPARQAMLRRMAASGMNLARLPILRSDDTGPWPASHAQQRQWFLWRLQPDSSAYHLTGALSLHGSLDPRALQAAFDRLQARHESLRTVFREGASSAGLEQWVLPASGVVIDAIDLRGETQTSRHARVTAEVRRTQSTPFDLAQGPLMRVTLLRRSDDEHVLVVVMHHIISDAWSMRLIVDEFAQLYAARVHGREADLPDPAVRYVDHAQWQREWLDAGEGERQLAYWRGQLGGEQPVLQLPSERPRQASAIHMAARHVVELPAPLAARVREAAQAQGATLFMVLLAGFQALLHRYSGLDDIRVGVPVANRHRAEADRVVGFFVNTQVLRAGFTPRLRWTDLLAATRQAALQAQDHQDVPFEQLVDALQPGRSLDHSPLFQVMFNHQQAGAGALQGLPGLRASPFALDGQAAQFELTLDTTEHADGRLSATLGYAQGLFSEAAMARMAAHYMVLLGAMASAPNGVIDDVPLLSEDEAREQRDWGCNAHAHPAVRPVHHLFDEQAERQPHAPALTCGETTLGYAELAARANALAHRLVAQGVSPDALVGVLAERSIEMVVALLAVLKAGGAYVPLDPDLPPDRLAYMVEDSGVAAVLAQDRFAQGLALPAGVAKLSLDGAASPSRGDRTDPPRVDMHGEHLAYAIYTSGSTGRPKGAANRHAALFNRLAWMQQAYGLTPDDVVLQKTPFGFDVSVWEFFWPLMVGARLVMAAPGDHRDPERLVDLIRRHGVTTLHFVPSMLQAFLSHEGIEACTSLSRIICSGEALPLPVMRETLRRLPRAGLYNLYGPTEAAIDVTHWTCADDGRASVPIGQPISDTRTVILDARLNPVPRGMAGELYLGGVGLARGYLKRPGLTSERFVADPQSVGGERLYRTGDLARWREDGQIEYLGRVDHQVKVRGLRIELGEIEARLQALPGVREAAVVAREGAGGTRLVAYVSLHQGMADADAAVLSLREALGRALPDYMVPSAIVPMAALPLNTNGKVDRKALPEVETAERPPQEPPVGALETTLAQLWSDVLRVRGVGRHDNFFELGGDSILSLQIVSRLRQAGWRITPRQLFERQTVARLAAVATRLHVEPESGRHDDAQALLGDIPLLPIQADFFERGVAAPHHWNLSVLLRSVQAIDPARLARALRALVDHHDALRLRFHPGPQGWRQVCLPAGQVDAQAMLWVRDAADARALTALCDEAQRSLDLSAGPLMRVLLARLPDGSSRLLLAAHHLVVDGVSWRVLLQDLRAAYEAAEHDVPYVLPARTSSVGRWSRRLQDQAPAHADGIGYWQGLAGVPVALPVADRGAARPRAGGHDKVRVALSPQATQALLRQAPMAYRTQVNDLLLSALAMALSEWTGHDRIQVDLEGHGREDLSGDLDLSRTVGWLTTLHPVVLDAGGGLADVVKRTKEHLRQVPARGLGHGVLRHLGTLAQRQAMAALPRPEVVFNYLGQFDGSFEPDGDWLPASDDAGQAMDPRAVPAHALTIDAQVYDGVLSLALGHDGSRWHRATIESLADACVRALNALIDHCAAGPRGLTPSDVPLAGLDQQALDALDLPAARLADLYPASAMQAGLLFHTMEDGDADAGHAYLNQLRLDVEGLDEARFAQAWQAVFARHEALRTGFLTAHDGSPLQWVDRDAGLPVSFEDWRGRDGLPQALTRRAEAELERGFDPARPPLMRIVLIRTDERRHHMVWTHHHVLMDGWSVSTLMGEVLRAYAGQPGAAQDGRYRDYIAWLLGRDAQAAQAHWTAVCAPLAQPTRLAGLLPAPPDGAAAASPGPVGHGAELDPADTRRLLDRARQERVTLGTLVQAAWGLVLARCTAQDVVCFGATTSGRPADLPGVEQMVGLFINTLPVVMAPPAGLAVGDWLRQVQDQALAAREHEHTPLYQVQRWAGRPGEALFDTLLVFENYPVDAALQAGAPAGLSFDVPVSREETHYPLSIAVVHDGDAFRLRFGYARDCFRARDIALLADSFVRVLRAMADDGRMPVGRIALAPPQAAVACAGLAAGEAVHHAIERQAAQRPDAVALVFDGRSLRLGELNARANRLARRLRAEGVRPEARVGVVVERSLDMVVALLAVLKAGAAYVPLDPDYPAERLAWMAQDSGIVLLLTQRHLHDRVPAGGVPSLDLGSLALGDGDGDGDGADLALAVHPAQLAYVIYTSGSTGRPKGVAVAHGPLAMHCDVTADLYEMGPHSREFHFLSFAFDGAHERWLTALRCGGAVVLRDQALWSAEQTLDTLARERVTNAGFPPAYLQQLSDWAAHTGQAPEIDLYSFGGEAMPKAGFDQARLALHPRLFINGYGPTEAVVTPLVWKVEAAATFESAYAPIGEPVGERSAHILDALAQPVPDGVPGELYLGGRGLARGYLDRAGLTAERFIADPFGADGGRLYRTGDLVRRREDGQIEYIGRLDHQVKVRGFRVELGEIEACLRQQPAVREAVVVARDGQGGTQLVAYVSGHGGHDDDAEMPALDAAAVREALAGTLPAHMVPSAIVVMAALPLTTTGKVDRAALPAPERAAGPGHEPPLDGVEQILAAVWREVLGLARVGRHDNFFELGGDSIVSLQIVARVRRQGWRISPRQLFDKPTIAALAGVARPVDGAGAAMQEAARPSGEVPLLPIQRLFFAREIPNRHHWNQSVLLQCDAPLALDRLQRALACVVAHHDALNLRFRRGPDDVWTQHHDESAQPPSVWHRVAAQADDIPALCEEAQRSLDLADGPLLRALAIDIEGDAPGHRLLLAAHHLVVDGVSWRVLLEDLGQAYGAVCAGREPVLPPRTSSLQHWAQRLRAHADAPAMQGETAHWLALRTARGALDGDQPQGARTMREAARRQFQLDAATTQRLLKEAPAAYRTQVNDLLLTALARALSPEDDLLIDLEGHGREDLFDDVDVSRTVGWFTSVFPVRLRAGGALGDAIKRIKQDLAEVPGRGLGFGLLQAWGPAPVREALARLPDRSVLFNYLGQFDSAAGAQAGWRPALEATGESSDADAPLGHEFSFNAQVLDGVFTLSVDYSQARHQHDRVERMMSRIEAQLRAVIDHCLGGASGLTPSDVPQAALTQAGLDALVARLGRPARDIEDIHPLTPMQQGMLFDAMLDPDAAVNLVQMQAVFDDLDVERLAQAWQAVVRRHAVLRAAFVWRADGEPLQVVWRQAPLSIVSLDWRARASSAGDWTALCEREYRARLPLDQAPLMRLVTARVGERQHRLVWTWHHILLDGWSMSRLLGEVFTLYGGQPLGQPGPRHGDFIAATRRSSEEGLAFWRGQLQGLDGPTLLAPGAPRDAGAQGHGAVAEVLDAVRTQQLQQRAAAQQVTLNTLVQGAWAQVLMAHTGRGTAVFGATMSGRLPDFDQVDDVMGLCVNTLPIVARHEPAMAQGDWLRGLMQANLSARQHEHVPLADIQRIAGQPGHPLFDTLIIFENYPVDQALGHGAEVGLNLGGVENRGALGMPLTLIVIPGQTLTLSFEYARRVFSAPVVADLLRQFVAVLGQWSEDGRRPMGDLVVPPPTVDLPGAGPWHAERPAAWPLDAAAARTLPALQARLADGWRALLDVQAVAPDDDFFVLGGDSLLAARLVTWWNGEGAGPALALKEVFMHPVLKDLAQAMAAGQATPVDPLTRLHRPPRRDQGQPTQAGDGESEAADLYCFPARLWHGQEFQALLEALPAGQHAASFVCDPGAELAWAGADIAALAARCADTIRAQGRGRPVALLGWSVGGLLAAETARHLAPDVPVRWIGLVDTSEFPERRALLAALPPLDAPDRARLEEALAGWLARSGMAGHWHAVLQGMDERGREAFLLQVVAAHGPLLPTDGPAQGSAEHALWSQMNCWRLGLAADVHPALPAPVLSWRSEAVAGDGDDAFARRYIAPSRWAVDIQVVPGTTHLDVLSSPAFHDGVAEALRGGQGTRAAA